VAPSPGPDVYNGAVGNTLVEVGVTASGFPAVAFSGSVLDNDSDPNGGPMTLTVSGTQGVTAGADVTMNTNGTFTYLPPAGFAGPSDSFQYVVTDGDLGSVGTVTINLANVVWYVRDTATPGGDGRSDAPFTSLASLQGGGDPDDPGDVIFLYAGAGTYTGGIILEASQQLIGEGAGLVIGGHALVAAGTRPVIGNAAGSAVALASGNTVRGLNASAVAGITGASVGALTIDDVAVTATAGAAASLANGTLAVTLDGATASGSASGIVLTTTGGTFEVTGDGSTPGSGGTVQGMSGDGVLLTNAADVSLRLMTIQNNLGNGVRGSTVTDFVLDRCTLATNGDSNASDEGDLSFTNLLGNAAIMDSTLTGGFEDDAVIVNDTGALTLAVTDSTFSSNDPVTGNNGLAITAVADASVTVTVTDSTFADNRATNVLFTAEDSASMDATVTGGSVSNATNGIAIETNGSSHVTFDVLNVPTITGHSSHALSAFQGAASSAASTLVGTFSGNVVGTNGVAGSGSSLGDGIRVLTTGAGTLTTAVTGNTVRNITIGRGISVVAQSGSAVLNATVTGNAIDMSEPTTSSNGVFSQSGATGTDTTSVCAHISGNTFTNTAGADEIRVRNRFAGTLFRLPGYAGGGSDVAAVAAFLAAQNALNGGSVTATVNTNQFTGGGACPTP
jgi:hypothetical protein